jgi:hypothetical protein
LKRFGFVRLLLCLSVLVFGVHKASALDATLSGDASVNSAHPGIHYGALSNLYVGNGSTTFLQFDLSLLPAGTTAAQVSHATLTLFVNRVNTVGTVTVSPVTGSWGSTAFRRQRLRRREVQLAAFRLRWRVSMSPWTLRRKCRRG